MHVMYYSNIKISYTNQWKERTDTTRVWAKISVSTVYIAQEIRGIIVIFNLYKYTVLAAGHGAGITDCVCVETTTVSPFRQKFFVSAAH